MKQQTKIFSGTHPENLLVLVTNEGDRTVELDAGTFGFGLLEPRNSMALVIGSDDLRGNVSELREKDPGVPLRVTIIPLGVISAPAPAAPVQQQEGSINLPANSNRQTIYRGTGRNGLLTATNADASAGDMEVTIEREGGPETEKVRRGNSMSVDLAKVKKVVVHNISTGAVTGTFRTQM